MNPDLASSLRDMERASKRWVGVLSSKIHDPFKLFPPTFAFVARIGWALLRIFCVGVKKIFNP